MGVRGGGPLAKRCFFRSSSSIATLLCKKNLLRACVDRSSNHSVLHRVIPQTPHHFFFSEWTVRSSQSRKIGSTAPGRRSRMVDTLVAPIQRWLRSKRDLMVVQSRNDRGQIDVNWYTGLSEFSDGSQSLPSGSNIAVQHHGQLGIEGCHADRNLRRPDMASSERRSISRVMSAFLVISETACLASFNTSNNTARHAHIAFDRLIRIGDSREHQMLRAVPCGAS